MANLKDLIVNGTSRLLGHLYVNGDQKVGGSQTIDGTLTVSSSISTSSGNISIPENSSLLVKNSSSTYNNLIKHSTSSGTMYNSSGSTGTSIYGTLVGNPTYNTKIQGCGYIYLDATFVSAVSGFTYSDSKIKKFTNDITEDKDKIVALFDLIDIKSYTRKDAKYPNQNILNTGICAQELEEHMSEVGLDNEKYNIIDSHYNFYIERGDDEEDAKYYTKFLTVNYDGLYNLSIVKMRDMEEKHIARLADLEERVSNLEKK